MTRVRAVTKGLDQIGVRPPAVLLLRTIPGVGIRTAETVVAYLDNARRFVRSSQVAAYFGLVPLNAPRAPLLSLTGPLFCLGLLWSCMTCEMGVFLAC